MKLLKKLALMAMPLVLLAPFSANAAIVFPALDIQNFGGDAGVTITATTLDIDATVSVIILDDLNLPTSTITIPNVAFIIENATGTSVITTPAPGFTLINGSYSGSFTIGSLLSGTFTNLVLSGLEAQPTLQGDVTYTGGSLQGNLTGGRLELAIAGSNVAGKLGEVSAVPVPAAVWLFGSGLLGLVGVARRRA